MSQSMQVEGDGATCLETVRGLRDSEIEIEVNGGEDDNDEDGEEINMRMMEKLINEARQDVDSYRLMSQRQGKDNGSAQQEQRGSIPRRRQGLMSLGSAVQMESSPRQAVSSPVEYNHDMPLSIRQQVNLIQQGRQEREVRQRRQMNDFLDQLDQEIDDAIPIGTKNKYRPIQDDFEVLSFILRQADDHHRCFVS
ncbi:MAG: hypothetical protein E6J34_19020 [Chloroflexi bacterium]|nr:MAG: hypothetical protein E6J34_19020 [Chloroflexota bacterium]